MSGLRTGVAAAAAAGQIWPGSTGTAAVFVRNSQQMAGAACRACQSAVGLCAAAASPWRSLQGTAASGWHAMQHGSDDLVPGSSQCGAAIPASTVIMQVDNQPGDYHLTSPSFVAAGTGERSALQLRRPSLSAPHYSGLRRSLLDQGVSCWPCWHLTNCCAECDDAAPPPQQQLQAAQAELQQAQQRLEAFHRAAAALQQQLNAASTDLQAARTVLAAAELQMVQLSQNASAAEAAQQQYVQRACIHYGQQPASRRGGQLQASTLSSFVPFQ